MTTNLCVVDNTEIRRASLQTVLLGIRAGNNLLRLYDAMESAYLAGSQTVVTNCNNDCATCTRNITYLDLKDPLILFIHTSNKCFYRFVNDLLNSNRDCHVVCYSGGESSDDYNKLIKITSSKIRFFPRIPPNATVGDINSKWDIKGFVEAVIEGKPNPFDFLERKGSPHLIALSILCQGYLAVKDPDKIKFTNKIDLTNKDIPADWWNPAFGPDEVFENTGVSKEIKALGKEAPPGITNLFNKKKEPTADLVFEAYKSLPEILKA